jgi:hypothetical protein
MFDGEPGMETPPLSDLTRAALINAIASKDSHFIDVREDAREYVENECYFRWNHGSDMYALDLYSSAMHHANNAYHLWNDYQRYADRAASSLADYRHEKGLNPLALSDYQGMTRAAAIAAHRTDLASLWERHTKWRMLRDRTRALALEAMHDLCQVDMSTAVD